MTQKEFYEKNKEYIHAYFSGECVERDNDGRGWEACQPHHFSAKDWSFPADIVFRIDNENDMFNDAIKDQLDMDIPKKEASKLPEPYKTSERMGLSAYDLNLKLNEIINYLKTKEVKE